MAFAPDVHVFPGGRVDPTDAHPSLVARSVVSPQDAAAALGGDLPPTQAIAAFIAAIRESFEEAGVLLADVGPGSSPGALGAARAALVGGEIGFQALAAQLDLTLRTDWLVPISRWVTPPSMPRRFDARFFAAELPDGAKASIEGDEVVEHTWLRPADALDAMAAGEFAMWLPTSTTLQQLEHVRDFEEVRSRLAQGPLGSVEVDEPADGVVRIAMPAGGGVAGQPVNAYLVGRRSFVLVDPGDPTGPGLERAFEEAESRGGTIRAIALTHVDADHAAGAELVAMQFEAEVLVGPGGGRRLPVRDPRAGRRRRHRCRRHPAAGADDARPATGPRRVPRRRGRGRADRRPGRRAWGPIRSRARPTTRPGQRRHARLDALSAGDPPRRPPDARLTQL